jgi:hypothetical protein
MSLFLDLTDQSLFAVLFSFVALLSLSPLLYDFFSGSHFPIESSAGPLPLRKALSFVFDLS